MIEFKDGHAGRCQETPDARDGGLGLAQVGEQVVIDDQIGRSRPGMICGRGEGGLEHAPAGPA